MEEITLCKIGDVVNVNTAQYTPKDKWVKALYLDTGNITENKIDEIQEFECSSLPSRARRKVKHGDIVYSTVRPNQKHFGYITDPASNLLVSTGFAVLSPKKEYANSKFIYYWLSQNEIVEYLHTLAEQSVSAYPSIKASDICNLEVELPSLTYQTKVADILSSIDTKIELNRRINDNLEQQAQGLFDDCLANSHSTSICKLSDIADINPRRIISKTDCNRYIEMSNLPTKGSFPIGWEYKQFNGGMKFSNGDTIMARITPCLENGKVAYINFLEGDEVAFGSTEYIVISSKGEYPSEWFYFLTRNKQFVDYAIKNMNGSSGRQRVAADSIAEYELPFIAKRELNSAFSIAKIALKTIKNNSIENMRLSAIRDALLPKLMSGELKVNDLNS